MVEGLDVPVGVGEEAVEAGLVGGLGELAVDARDVLAFGDEQAGEVLGEVAALALVGEQVAVSGQGVLHDLGESMMPGMSRCSAVPLRQSQSEEKWSGFTYFNASGDHFAKHQLQLLLAGEDPEGEGRRGSNTGHDGEVDRSCVDASGVDQATSYPTCIGHSDFR